MADPAGAIAHRLGAFERIAWVIEDWDTARAKLADTEARMVAVLDDLQLTELACSIQRLSPVGAGRPHLRTAAWRAVWGAVKSNPVYAARYRHLTSRETNMLKPTQAQTVLAGAIVRQLHAVVTTWQAWDPEIATHGTCNKSRTLAEVAA